MSHFPFSSLLPLSCFIMRFLLPICQLCASLLTDISQNQYNLHDKEYKSIKRTTSSPFINHILPQTNCFSHFGSYLDPVHYKALVSTLRIFTMVYTSLQLNKSLFLLLNTTEYHCKNSSRLHNQNTPVFIMKMLLSHQGKRNSHNFHLDTFY
jgi:hypothetical protein